MRSGVRILATPAEGVVGDWSTAPRPIIVSAVAASEGGRKKSKAAGNCVVLGFPPFQQKSVATVG